MTLTSARIALLTLVGLAGACQSHGWADGPESRAELMRFGEQRQHEWDQLKQLKAELRWDHDDPIVFDFGDRGELTVRRWALEGGPGWESVRARVMFRNTTGEPIDRVKVVLAVLDAEGNPVSAGRLRMQHPWGLPLGPWMMYTDEVEVPLAGAHRRPEGWHWKVELETIPWVPIEEPDDLYASAEAAG